MIGVVYLLRNPLDGTVFYVGQTVYKISERLRGHLSEKSTGTKNSIIKSILSQNLMPVIEELESVEYNPCGINLFNERELFWIKHYTPIGNLLHVAVYVKQCAKCVKTFESKRSRAMYCSDVCRASVSQSKRASIPKMVNDSSVFKKKTVCDYCKEEMNAKYRNKKFCSDKCRVYRNREVKYNAIKISQTLPKQLGIKDAIVEEKKQTSLSIPTYNDVIKMAVDGKTWDELKEVCRLLKLNYNQINTIRSKIKS